MPSNEEEISHGSVSWQSHWTHIAMGAVLVLAASGAAGTATANCVAQGSAQRTQNRDFDRRGLYVNIDDQIIQSVLRKRKGEVFAELRGRVF
jgi:hypothetical protein